MVGKKATNKASKEGRSEGMQELERHYAAINCWKGAKWDNPAEIESRAGQTTEGRTGLVPEGRSCTDQIAT